MGNNKKIIFIYIFLVCFSVLFSQSDFDKESWEVDHQKALAYIQQGNYDGALYYELRALIIIEQEFGKKSRKYAVTLNNVGLLYQSVGKFVDAESSYIDSIKIFKNLFFENKLLDYANSMKNLADLYRITGRYEEAELVYKIIIKIYKSIPPKNMHPDYALILNNLAFVYRLEGRYEEAKPLYKEAINIYKTLAPTGKHQDYATGLNNLALLYRLMGRYEEAEPLYKEAIDIYKTLAPTGKHQDYATGLNNLALLYKFMEKYMESESLYKQALNIRKTLSPEEQHPYYAESLNNLALLYETMGRYQDAEFFHLQAMIIRKTFLPQGKHPYYAASLNNLALLYQAMGKYKESELLHKQAIEIRKPVLSKSINPDYITSLGSLIWLYDAMGNYEETEKLFFEFYDLYNRFIQNNFIALIEIDKNQLYESVKYTFEKFYSYLEKRINSVPEKLITTAYDVQLLQKTMLFDSSKKMITDIHSSKKGSLRKTLDAWLTFKRELVKEYKEEKEKMAEKLEEKLLKESKDFAYEYHKLFYNWKDIQKQLKKNEVGVEIIRYAVYDKKWTDEIHYAVLILKSTSEFPEIVFLKNGNELENELLYKYKEVVKNKDKTTDQYELFQAYWEQIDKKLSGIDHVFLSSDGVYKLIDINSLKDKTGKNYNKKILRVTSTKDIIK